MSGIAGFYLREGEAPLAAIRAMCDRLRHRGPDGEGYHLDGGCALGARRLSVVDPAGGHQPLSNEDRSVWLAFDGEIYNHRELRRDLIARGHRFATACDTETVVHSYEQEGRASLARLRGMFAFALWDSRRRRFFLARDRFGKKPLYYAVRREGLWFASELKSLVEAGVPGELDREALRLYFQFGYLPDPYTPFREVRKLEPGGWLEYDASTGRFETDRYWRLPAPAEAVAPDLTEPGAREQLRELLDQAVKLRMTADVPVGAFLDGSLNGSLVAASMARLSRVPVRTFSIGFEDSPSNAMSLAREAAEALGAEHRETVIRPDIAALVPDMVRWFDEPFSDSAALSTFLLSRFAREHVKVVLSGEGGDEIFAGRSSLLHFGKLRWWDRVPQGARALLQSISENLPYSAGGKNYLHAVTRSTVLERYFERNYAPYYLREELLEPEWMLPADSAYLARTLSECLVGDDADALTEAMYFEATAGLTGDTLARTDRASMAASLEVRCPLLDQELAEFAARIPHAWKIRNGRGKDILIQAVGDRLPSALTARCLQRSEPPLGAWLNGPLREMLWDYLTSQTFLTRGFASEARVKQLLEQKEAGNSARQKWLWSLLILEIWFRDFGPVRVYADAF